MNQSQKNIVSFLKANGITFDINSLKIISYQNDSKKLPKLLYKKGLNIFTVFYNVPNSMYSSNQSFSFPYEDFIFAFNEAKFKHFKSKSDYLSFNEIFFKNTPNANYYLKLLFYVFSITPTILKKATQHKEGKKYTIPSSAVKVSHIISSLGFIQNKKLKVNTKNAETPKVDYLIDQGEVTRLNYNMQVAIEKAATSSDLSFFEEYLQNYIDLLKLYKKPSFISNKKYANVFKDFSQKVDFVQKKL